MTGLVAVGALAGFAIAVGYAYQKGREAGTSGAVPIITAQPGPFKVKPDNPGGMAVPNRDTGSPAANSLPRRDASCCCRARKRLYCHRARRRLRRWWTGAW